MENAVDKVKVFGALLTDLSKAFDCLPHEFIIAKLNAYGFNLPALKLMHSYLSRRKQRTNPVDTRRRFNIYKKSIRRRQRRIDVL